MGILALAADERIADVEISEDELSVRLRAGRKISVPLAWYPRLLHATEEQRNHWEIDSTRSIREQNISKELNKAADLQSKTLDNVLSETERLESFALRINFLIKEKFGQSRTP